MFEYEDWMMIDYVWVYKYVNGWWLSSDDYECICE